MLDIKLKDCVPNVHIQSRTKVKDVSNRIMDEMTDEVKR